MLEHAMSSCDNPLIQSHPFVSLDCVIFTVKAGCLYVILSPQQETSSNPQQWLLPSAQVDLKVDRNLEQALRRVMLSQYSLDLKYLEQVKTLGNYCRDVRGWAISIVYCSLMNWYDLQSKLINNPGLIIMPVAKLRDVAQDHHSIIRSAGKRLRNKAHYTSLPLYFMPPEFTFSELQFMYEIVLEKKLEKKSFRRRMADAQLLQLSGGMRYSGNRPARLYQVKANHVIHYFARNLRGSYPLLNEEFTRG